MQTIAFIPAKKESTRLPGKNMRTLCGYPMLYYSIKAALLTPEISKVVVSSDDDDILNYSKQFEVECVKRSTELSLPDVGAMDVVFDYLNSLNTLPDLIVLLQPTHPLRHPKDISEGIAMMNTDLYDSIYCVAPTRFMIGVVENDEFKKVSEEPLYDKTGSFYIFSPKVCANPAKPFGEVIGAYKQHHWPLDVDVDYLTDFVAAEAYLNFFKKEFSYFYTAQD